jgi:hypothetical protein
MKVYRVKTKVWIYPGDTPWHFVTIDQKESKEIKEKHGKVRRGFGSIPVEVKVGKTSWKTSVFPNKDGTYLLPIKAKVRKQEGIFEDDTIEIMLKF